MPSWDRLARFQTEDGQAYWAVLELHETEIAVGTRAIGFSTITELEQDKNNRNVVVKEVLAPVPSPENPIICLGSNYATHAEEAKVPKPTVPACMWLKSRYTLAHHNSPIPIPKHPYENFLDYEGELVIVTARDALNVSIADANQYILGYTCGNDLTARHWHEIGRSSMQLGFSKGYDKFAPLGPSLISHEAWKSAAGAQHLKTSVNGKVVQDTALNKMIFSPEEIVSFLSQGHTLAGGSAIMTGTPLGVGFFSDPPYSLKDGDSVHVEITPIGTLKNTMKFM